MQKRILVIILLALIVAQSPLPAIAAGMDNVTCIETRDFFRPPEQSPTGASYHWNSNAETYLLIGQGMGEAMKELLTIKARKAEKLGMQR